MQAPQSSAGGSAHHSATAVHHDAGGGAAHSHLRIAHAGAGLWPPSRSVGYSHCWLEHLGAAGLLCRLGWLAGPGLGPPLSCCLPGAACT